MFRRNQAPAKVSTDIVCPLRWFDDTPLWKSFILYSTFVFDEVLDPAKLRDSLEALAHRDGWRKMGARLRRNAKGELEYHIPAEFTKDRPAIAFSHTQHAMKAADHDVASRIPKPSTRPAVVGYPDEMLALFPLSDVPKTMEDYITRDIPQVGLHVVSFEDKTVIGLCWPHTAFDAMGKKLLLKGWTLMLEGRADEIPKLTDPAVDPLADFGLNPTEEHVLAPQRLSVLNLAQYGIGNVFNFMAKPESRMVCVPGSLITKLRTQALAELEAEKTAANGGGGAGGDEKPFLSEGDVICAWWTRLAVAHLPATSSRPLVLNNAMSLRKLMAGGELPAPGGDYLSNAIMFFYVTMRVRDVFEKPLSWVAARIRGAIAEQGTQAQAEAFAHAWRSSSWKLPPFFGAPNMHMLTLSNWSQAGLFDFDFSAAALATSGSHGGGGGRSPCTPSYVQNNQFGVALPDAYPVIGKDKLGNFWMSGYMKKVHWDMIEVELAKIEME
ncbi:hypothetical protein F4778DRAFT_99452 [Xylariomycetidae sp. FL2044]|nr:hypothetical protein F4778DRAFT_99452 [Xylariomycetidae sp. FL2044]